jgi:acyl-coenzyme A thioesterase PaaI-like protein
MLAAVPFAQTLNVAFPEVGTDESGRVRVVAELPDNPAVHNHIGGPHAGALFTLGETASGAVVMASFGDQLGRATPLAVRAEIGYRKVAMGTVRATAKLGRPVADVLAELDAGARPEFPVEVELTTLDGTLTAQLTVVWTLRPHR